MEQTLLSFLRGPLLRCLVCSIGLVPSLVLANPNLPNVAQGNVGFTGLGTSNLQVNQTSQSAIINWTDFSINAGEQTQFNLPGASAATLNRVTGGNPSSIFGSLRSNGTLLLINPNGIVFGVNGQVDVAGSFVASTLDVTNADFLDGGDLAFLGATDATIVNLGDISVSGGDVFLIAATVDNQSTISAPNGTVGLAAGNDVLLRESGEERVFVRGASGAVKTDGVVNTGTIEANIAELKSHGGNIYATAIRNEGRVAATGVTTQGGQIFLSAGAGSSRIVNTGAGELVAKRPATGSGGNVSIRNSGEGSATEIAGTVDAEGDGPGGVGGDVVILAEQIDLLPATVILADGDSGGGNIRIGGGRHGADPGFNNAQNVTIGAGSLIDANATSTGDGGEIIFFAEDTLDFSGRASARGGATSGNGGFIELAGERDVNFDGFVDAADTGALFGADGTLFFDTFEVIVETGAVPAIPGAVVFEETTIFAGDMANYLQSRGNLEIRSSGTGTNGGNISHVANSSVDWISPNSLKESAEGSIVMAANSAIQSVPGSITLENVNGTTDGILLETNAQISSNNGDIHLIGRGSTNTNARNAGIRMNVGSQISASGSGSIMLEGTAGVGQDGVSRSGVGMDQASVTSNSGDIVITGTGVGNTNSDQNTGVFLDQSQVTTTSGEITVTGTGGVGTSVLRGVVITGSGSEVSSMGTGTIRIDGTGGNGGANFNLGVSIGTGARVANADGDIVIDAAAGAGTGTLNEGIRVTGAGTVVSTTNGDITIKGIGGDGTQFSRGVLVTEGAVVESNGGNILFEGTGGNGGNQNEGVKITRLGTFVRSVNGNVTLSGVGGTGTVENDGIEISSQGVVETTGTGTVSFGGRANTVGRGIHILTNGVVRSNSGPIFMEGTAIGVAGAAGNMGITVENATVSTVGGNITFSGTGGLGTNNNHGLQISSATVEATNSGDLFLKGTASTSTTGQGNFGVIAEDSTIRSPINGAITFEGIGGTGTEGNHGVRLDNSDVTGNQGTITIDGRSVRGSSGSFNRGVRIFNGSTVTALGDSDITVVGSAAMNDGQEQTGVLIDGAGTSLTSSNGNISITGTGGDGLRINPGVQVLSGAAISSVGTGDLTIYGTGGKGGDINEGVRIRGTGTSLSATDGNITVTGVGGAGTELARGALIFGGATIAVGNGDITIVGEGGSGGNGNEGVRIDQAGTQISSVNGDISITGTGGSGTTNNDGVEVSFSAGIVSTGSGDIKIEGSATSGTAGVSLFETDPIQTATGDIHIKGTQDGARAVRMFDSMLDAQNGMISVTSGTASSSDSLLSSLQASEIVLESTGGDFSFSTGGLFSAGTLTLSSPLDGFANFDFSGGDVSVDALSVTSPIGSIDLSNLGNLTTGGITAENDIFIGSTGVLGASGVLNAGDEVRLTGETINLDQGVFAGVGITTGPNFIPKTTTVGSASADVPASAFFALSGHVLHARGGLDAPLVIINGSDASDSFTVAGQLGDRFGGRNVEVNGGFNFDTLETNRLDLESTTLSSVESVRGTGQFSSIIGRDTNETYVFSGAGDVSNQGRTFEGFSMLESGMGDDLFEIAGTLTSGPYINDMGGIDRLNTAPGINDIIEMDELNEGIANGVLEFGGVEIIDTNTGDDLFLLDLGAASNVIIGGEGTDRIHADGLFLIGESRLEGFEEIKGVGDSDLLALVDYESSPGQTFSLASDGSIRHEGTNYLGFEQLWGTDTGDDLFLVESNFSGSVSIDGQGGMDTLAADNADSNVFTIDENQGGNLNERVRFSSVEVLKGGGGEDRFEFKNQATVESVDGADGQDAMTIDDSTLGGTNTYDVSDGLVSRNPEYRFSNIESLQLLLGPGDDTVNAGDNGFDLNVDGGDGYDTLNTDPSVELDGNPVELGNSTIRYSGFEAPFAEEPLSGFFIFDVGDILTLELGETEGGDLFLTIEGEDGEPIGNGGTFLVENNYNESGEITGYNLLGLTEGGGGFFGVAPAAVSALVNVGQVVVITLDGEQFLLDAPASLDGTFSQPSFDIIESLRENLNPDANGELARALEFGGGAFLINHDGAYSIDLSGPPPPALVQLLQENLQIGAAQELTSALGFAVALPLTNLDGVTVIGLVAVQPGQATIQALLDHLGEAAETELADALGN